MDASYNAQLRGLESMKKYDNLWYEDGNVVFCAGQSKFRVYKGILSAHSKKLGDLIASAEDASDASSLLVVTLLEHDMDVHNFFLALFDPSFYIGSGYSFHVTLSILRLAQKYEVHFLVRRTLRDLDSALPMRREKLMFFALQSRTRQEHIEDPSMMLNNILGILAFVHDNAEFKWITPRVLFFIVNIYKIGDIIRHPSFFFRLTPDGQAMIIEGGVNQAVEQTLVDPTSWVGMLPSAECSDAQACSDSSREMAKEQYKTPSPVSGCPDPARVRKVNLHFKFLNGDVFCQNCRDAVEKQQSEARDAYWSKCAEICGFNDWEEVECARNKGLAALG